MNSRKRWLACMCPETVDHVPVHGEVMPGLGYKALEEDHREHSSERAKE